MDPFCAWIYSQERRSPGWRLEDPSRGFLAPWRGAHRVGGGKIRLGPGNISLLRRGAHRTETPTKIRLGDFSLPGEALTGLEAGRTSLLWRGAHRAGGGKNRLGPGKSLKERRSLGKDPSRGFLVPRRGAHRVGGWKIRLGDFLFPGEALTGLEVGRSVLDLGI